MVERLEGDDVHAWRRLGERREGVKGFYIPCRPVGLDAGHIVGLTDPRRDVKMATVKNGGGLSPKATRSLRLRVPGIVISDNAEMVTSRVYASCTRSLICFGWEIASGIVDCLFTRKSHYFS